MTKTKWTEEERKTVVNDFAQFKNGAMNANDLVVKYRGRTLDAIKWYAYNMGRRSIEKVAPTGAFPKPYRLIAKRLESIGIEKSKINFALRGAQGKFTPKQVEYIENLVNRLGRHSFTVAVNDSQEFELV